MSPYNTDGLISGYMVKMVKVKMLLTGVKNKMVKMVITQFLFLTEPLKVKILLTRVKNKRSYNSPILTGSLSLRL